MSNLKKRMVRRRWSGIWSETIHTPFNSPGDVHVDTKYYVLENTK